MVAYNNLSEVDDYIDILERLPDSSSFGYAVCDNSLRSGQSRHDGNSRFCLVSRPDNPGYLEGALLAYEAWREAGRPAPDWAGISNTDLVPLSGSPLTQLGDYDPSRPVIVAPRITEGTEAIEKNPHVMSRRSLRRLRVNALVSRFAVGALAYQATRVGWWKLSRHRRTSRHNPRDWASKHPAGQQFYSPYGALFFVSRGFALEAMPREVPLLSEEYFVAETAITLGARVLYEPAIHVHHEAHVTTGPKVGVVRARRTSRAFRAIYNHARDERDDQ